MGRGYIHSASLGWGHNHRTSLSRGNTPISQVGLTVDNTQGARSGAAQEHLTIGSAASGGATRARVDSDLVVLHRSVHQSRQIAGHDVLVAAAGGTDSLYGVAAIMCVLGADLQ